ncbi:MAG: inositol monophosphatase [Deltaproteobacteria bacterium]|nr:inositol monophosphatase [Deltaproteobacteria bacterium]
MWEKELSTAREAAENSGDILNRLFGKNLQIKKKGVVDLVTEADLQSESTIVRIIQDRFPQDTILTEESGIHQRPSKRVWIIDPLDGTTNFAHAFPFFAVSIALEVENEIILGLVYNPYTNERFEAVKGKGAFLNRGTINVSSTRHLEDSLLATGFPYHLREDPHHILDLFAKIIVCVQGVRRPGSAAIDLCYVAAGRLDGFWEEGLNPWDTAAGSLIVSEAGGVVTDFQRAPYHPYQGNILAANPFIHIDLAKILNSI